MQQRRLGQLEDDVDVHRAIEPQAGGADFVGEPHAAVDFHGTRIDALHLRQKRRPLLLLDQRAAHAAPGEIDGEREAGRAGADDENIVVQLGHRGSDYPGGSEAASSVNGV